ncbi:hypothetical protein [Azospirillum brasilense]|uniref:hypothetical protein n=1 Tax=Azospirillum brasilense TaxID=192 RepID=UPI0011F02B93|nr:hypothetical protein [Azospirillum brasilense]
MDGDLSFDVQVSCLFAFALVEGFEVNSMPATHGAAYMDTARRFNVGLAEPIAHGFHKTILRSSLEKVNRGAGTARGDLSGIDEFDEARI